MTIHYLGNYKYLIEFLLFIHMFCFYTLTAPPHHHTKIMYECRVYSVITIILTCIQYTSYVRICRVRIKYWDVRKCIVYTQ